jgi:ABC-type cobalt transport system substrate-binding protein
VSVVCIIGLLLIGQFIVYYQQHKDNGGGADGEIGGFIISLGGGAIGVLLLMAAGLAQLIK